MREALVRELRSLVPVGGTMLFPRLCLLCLIPAILYTALWRNAIGLFASLVLIIALALVHWILRMRNSMHLAQQNSELLCAELGRTIEDLNSARETIDENHRANHASMSRLRHDLIGPIGSIDGFLQLLQDGEPPLSPRRLAFIENIERSIQNLVKVAGRLEQKPDTGEPPKKPAVSCQSMNPANENSGVRTWIIPGARGRR